MTLTIKTNNVPRDIVYGFELITNEKVRKQFDWMNDEEFSESSFFCYKNYWYSLQDFMRPNGCFEGWDGVHSDTYFSGQLVKLHGDEQVIVGCYFS